MPVRSGRDVIVGYYGFGNFGDDLFRDILSKAVTAAPWSHLAITQAGSSPIDKISRNVRAVGNILRARSITLGGGSILGARPPFGIRHIEMFGTSLKKIPYCAIGVGVLENLPKPPHNIINKMSWVGIRSEADFKELRPIFPQIHYTSDIAYAAPAILMDNPEARFDKENEILVIPAGIGELGKISGQPEQVRNWIEGNIVPFIKQGYAVKIILLQPLNPDDVRICEIFSKEVGRLTDKNRLVSHETTGETLMHIASSQFVFTDRLHGAIVSHICGVPFRLSKHHQKCIDLLTDIGHPDAGEDRSYVADRTGVGVPAVWEWAAGQADTVRRHAQHANAGIQAWLGHLKERVN